jgi:hypothetical protein
MLNIHFFPWQNGFGSSYMVIERSSKWLQKDQKYVMLLSIYSSLFTIMHYCDLKNKLNTHSWTFPTPLPKKYYI